MASITHPNCSGCPLSGRRIVWGNGPTPAKYMVIGESPGQEEVANEKPFVGESGRLLRKVLRGYGVKPGETYYTNLVMCKPPNKQNPQTKEIESCFDRLASEIEAVQPQRILLLGSSTVEYLLGVKFMEARGIPFKYKGIPVIPTYSPAQSLRVPDIYRDFESDIGKFVSGDFEPLLPLGEDGYPDVPYTLLNPSNIFEWLDLHFTTLDGSGVYTFDIETSGFDPMKDELLEVGIGTPEMNYIILGEHLKEIRNYEAFRRFLLGDDKKIIHNLQFEHAWMAALFDIEAINNAEDSMLMHYAIDERSGSDEDGRGASYHSLKTLGTVWCNVPDWSEAMKPYKHDFSEAPDHIRHRYLSADLATTRIVFNKIIGSREWQEAGERVYRSAMIEVAPVLADMSYYGVKVDLEYASQLDAKWEEQQTKDIEKFQEAIGIPGINIRSPKQVAEAIYDIHKLPKVPRQGRGTGKDVIPLIEKQLKKLKKPIPEFLGMISDIRSKATIRSTFIQGVPKLIDEDGYVHTSFLIHGTDTGRLASRRPNLQNIPARIGSEIRDMFITEEDESFIDTDYKQLEFRILALLSRDSRMIEFLNSGRDIHSEVAAEYFNIEYGTETDQQRIDAKAVVFGIMYGRGAASIADEYGLTLKEAQRRIDIYNSMFPEVADWVERQVHSAINNRYVETFFGHRRRFPIITNRNKHEIQRHAVNSSIQGTASSINTLSSVRVSREVDPRKSKPIILVHDSLVQRCYDIYLDEVIPQTVEIMERNLYDSPVELKVDVKVGKRWGSCEKWKKVS